MWKINYACRGVSGLVHKNDLLPRLAPLAFIRMMNFTSLIDIEDEAECEDDVFYDNIMINQLKIH